MELRHPVKTYLLLVDGSSKLLQTDSSSYILLEPSRHMIQTPPKVARGTVITAQE